MDADATEAKGEEVPAPKAQRKKRKHISFVDDSCQEAKPRRKKKGSQKKVKTKATERKPMIAAQSEIKQLLNIMQDPNDERASHYLFPDRTLMTRYAEALHWAYIPSAEDNDEKDYICPGFTLFWDWWSKPMRNLDNKQIRKELDCDDPVDLLNDKKVAWEDLIQRNKDLWTEVYTEAKASQDALRFLRGWIKHIMEHQNITINPDCTDRTMASMAVRYLSSTFYVIDENGASIVWEPKEKLWIHRKKERSSIALGASLFALIGDRIVFTDKEAEEKFSKKCSSSSCVSAILNWLKGQTPVFPHPIKQKLDRECWHVPLMDGKIMDLKTLEIRDRNSNDLFTGTMNFEWFTNLPNGESYIMDAKTLDTFKDWAKNIDRDRDPFSLIEKLCPNAWQFTKGPFQNGHRHSYALLHFGLFLTSLCLRAGIWIYGDGKGLKSTVLGAIRRVMGPFAVDLAKKVFFTSGAESGHNTDLMRAEGKRLVVIDELERKDQLRETIYKQFTAHCTISAREIFGGQGEWDPMGTAVFLTNTVVSLNFTDNAVPDRIKAIKGMTRVFRPDDVSKPIDFTTSDEWKDGLEEATGIYWILKSPEKEQWSEKFLRSEDKGGHSNELGCLLVLCAHLAYHSLQTPQSRGEIIVTSTVAQDYKDFIQEADQIGQYLAENCDCRPDYACEFKDMWKDYKQWCEEQGVKLVEQKILRASVKQKGLLYRDKKTYFNKKTGKNGKSGAPIWFVRLMLKSSQVFEVNEDLAPDVLAQALQHFN